MESPSLLEVLQVQEIDELVLPSIKYIFAYFTHRHPRQLLRIYNSLDDIHCVLKVIFEYRSLKKWNATSVERRFQLKRVKSVKDAGGLVNTFPEEVKSAVQLSQINILAKIFLSYCLPYLFSKIKTLSHSTRLLELRASYNVEHNNSENEGHQVHPSPSLNFRSKILLKLKRLLSILKLMFQFGSKFYNSIRWAYYVLFALGTIPFSNPVDHLLKQRLIYDTKIPNRTSEKALRFYTLPSFLDNSMSIFLSLVQVLDWWQTNDYATQIKKGRVAFTELEPPELSADNTSSTKNICKICGHSIKNPAVLSTGFVFCYPCIQSWLKDNPFICPVSKLKLVRKEKSFWRIMV
ncbi:ubiquitin-protein ligase E3 [Schizosaccharomyces cryophilus OY26]|uniref:Peroxisome assembly protein 12 n=1 Tax=Schizosaccharomyces cryophilus (strain OY26 / ATCC MYA-4695 / CBS 11777 / NBRC 106824 / NRRL Y48691) TaxID=653667 RepID=S9VYK5_SCHCR|nr:ubiquitin-protein ligase E3 [Schizosaccharomyces cryophilus OY26]EPY50885.1 ubiquitin-protein ligase E3 [Schizosaccharomyces cryophilus OY26]